MESAPLGASIQRLREELGALDRAYSPGHHGLWSARRRAELLDGILAELFEDAGPPAGVALAAIGGYGRAHLLPRSDIDLLIVHDGRSPTGRLAALTEPILYPLWDGGFEVGHAVRTPHECEQAAREQLDALTSMLDLRPLAGDLASRARPTASAPSRPTTWRRSRAPCARTRSRGRNGSVSRPTCSSRT